MKKEKKYYFDLQKVPLQSERDEIRKKRNKKFITFLGILLIFISGAISSFYLFRNIRPSYDTDIKDTLGEIEYILDKYWLYSENYEDFNKELEKKALYGMTAFDEDPYTSYMSVEEINEFSSSINMNYVGVGVEYSYIDDVAIIKKVFKNSPAEKAGILAGDIIKSVDGFSIDGMSSQEIKEVVIGEKGSEVVIGVLRGNESLNIAVIRDEIDSTVYAYKEDDFVVLEINSFGDGTGNEIIKYLNSYTNLNKLIIDLRNNTGGYQSSVKEVSGIFIGNNKPYLIQEDVDGNRTTDYSKARKTFSNFKKIVVITNENTASAAEVLAICLKEMHNDVTIVGTKTFGKGVIQSTHLLNNGGALKLTTYNWYSPNGISIQNEGVTPDIEVRMPDIYYEYYVSLEDDQYYKIDEVSEAIRIAELSLDFLGYKINRADGYFDQSFEDALIEFKLNNNLGTSNYLDKPTSEAILSAVNRTLSYDIEKDSQFNKAKELLNGN